MSTHSLQATSRTQATIREVVEPPTKVVFVGLNLFIVLADRVAVALLKPLEEEKKKEEKEQAEHGPDCGHAAGGDGQEPMPDHAAYVYENARDRGTVGKADKLRSFPDPDGGQWVGTLLTGERRYGDPASGGPDVSTLQTKQFRLANLRTLGTAQGAPRELRISWPLYTQAVIELYGGTLEPGEPVLADYRHDWDFRTEEGKEVPTDRRLYLAEQVVWQSGYTENGTVIVTNMPFETPGKPEDEKQLTHFKAFYQVFTDASQEPILLPTDPSTDIEVYPIFCPPALYV